MRREASTDHAPIGRETNESFGSKGSWTHDPLPFPEHPGLRPPFRTPPRPRNPMSGWLPMSSPLAVRIPCDHVMIEGLLGIPPKSRGLVLFAHGSGSSRHSPRNNFVARILRNAEVATLLMDLLTEEEEALSESRFDIGLLTERLVAVAAWVKEKEETESLPMGLFGASTGAAAALEAAALLGSGIFAVVSRGGRPDLASRSALARVTAPTLFLVGELDREVIALNREAFANLRCEKKLVIVPDATHLFEEPGTLEEVARLATGWVVGHLPQHD